MVTLTEDHTRQPHHRQLSPRFPCPWFGEMDRQREDERDFPTAAAHRAVWTPSWERKSASSVSAPRIESKQPTLPEQWVCNPGSYLAVVDSGLVCRLQWGLCSLLYRCTTAALYNSDNTLSPECLVATTTDDENPNLLNSVKGCCVRVVPCSLMYFTPGNGPHLNKAYEVRKVDVRLALLPC